jgi:hypothetical protein
MSGRLEIQRIRLPEGTVAGALSQNMCEELLEVMGIVQG